MVDESTGTRGKTMNRRHSWQTNQDESSYSRRGFLGGTMAAVAAGPLLASAATFAAESPASKAEPKRKIKVGFVGSGSRGWWITKFFQQHGGFQPHALADYFPEVAEKCGGALGVDTKRRFSGISAYKKVIESGVEAIVLQTPPGFFPEHAATAVDAGLHVYMAKPAAVDVPGCLRIKAAGKQATQKRRVFLVDYQMPTDPANGEVVKRIRADMGKLARVSSIGISGGHVDQPKTATIESRLRNSVWSCDIALGGGFILSFDIHTIDAAMWLLGRRPVAATGYSRIFRSHPHGDSADVTSVAFEYNDGLLHDHWGQGLPNAAEGTLSCKIFGETARAVLNYAGKVYYQRRHQKPFEAEVVGLYSAGVSRNIATFYEAITAGRFENSTVRRAVDGCLTGILGREAAARHARLTMEELLKENKPYEIDISGLKA
jgi:predicted dehydrogenase